MRIDRSHLKWLIGSAILVGACTAVYVPYARLTPGGPGGGSWIGLTLGGLGTAMIAYAGALGLRKRMLLRRIGSVTWWMRGHLWVGLASLPITLFHGAFEFGGAMTTALMALLILVVVSGVIGAALQHFLPVVMTAEVTEETAYEQIEYAWKLLRVEAYGLVAAKCGRLEQAEGERQEAQSLSGRPIEEKPPAAPIAGTELLSEFYLRYVCPYLRRPQSQRAPLANAVRAPFLFDGFRPRLDPLLHETFDALARICHEARQKARQVRIHRLLHGWLLFHVPLSIALLVLIPVHAIMALYY